MLRDRRTNDTETLDERLFSLQDANWSVTSIVDSTGDIRSRFMYSAYGAAGFLSPTWSVDTNVLDWQLLYGCYHFDSDSGLYLVHTRTLIPHVGVWAQRDPFGYVDSLNLYLYSLGRPLTYTDPMGAFVPILIALPTAGTVVTSADKQRTEPVYRCEADHACP